METKLKSMNRSLRMLNNESNMLDEILKEGRKGRSMKGIGFNSQDTDQEGHKTKMKFVSPEEAR